MATKDGNLFDKIAQGFAEAVADVRQKVVEEGWFGRTLEDGSTLEINTEPKSQKAEIVEAELMPYDPNPQAERSESFEEYRARVDRKEPEKVADLSKAYEEGLEQ